MWTLLGYSNWTNSVDTMWEVVRHAFSLFSRITPKIYNWIWVNCLVPIAKEYFFHCNFTWHMSVTEFKKVVYSLLTKLNINDEVKMKTICLQGIEFPNRWLEVLIWQSCNLRKYSRMSNYFILNIFHSFWNSSVWTRWLPHAIDLKADEIRFTYCMEIQDFNIWLFYINRTIIMKYMKEYKLHDVLLWSILIYIQYKILQLHK